MKIFWLDVETTGLEPTRDVLLPPARYPRQHPPYRQARDRGSGIAEALPVHVVHFGQVQATLAALDLATAGLAGHLLATAPSKDEARREAEARFQAAKKAAQMALPSVN
jgi:hypothetical protein